MSELSPYLISHERILCVGPELQNAWVKIKLVTGHHHLKIRCRLKDLYFCAFKTTRIKEKDKEDEKGSEVEEENVKKNKKKKKKNKRMSRGKRKKDNEEEDEEHREKKKQKLNWWCFSDIVNFEINCKFLNITSQYSGLSRFKIQLDDIVLGRNHLKEAVLKLSTFNEVEGRVDKETTKHLFCIPLSICESLRFALIQEHVNYNFESGVSLGWLASLVKIWQKLSNMKFAYTSFEPYPAFNIHCEDDLDSAVLIFYKSDENKFLKGVEKKESDIGEYQEEETIETRDINSG
jgi:Ribosome inactivating protein